jgi:hypothetical protein
VGQVVIITRVTDGREVALERFLADLPRDAPPTVAGRVTTPPSPFSGVLPPTHFARFVVIRLDRDEPYLFFSSAFDGDTVGYLRALAATPQALTIWSHCHLYDDDDDTLTSGALEQYLCDPDNWRRTQYAVSAVTAGATVGQINRALSLRTQLGALMTRAALSPTALAHDFRQLPAVQALMSRR